MKKTIVVNLKVNNIVLKIWDDEGSYTTFYTVFDPEDAGISETDKFLKKYNSMPLYKAYVQELVSLLIDVIADEYGAIDCFFNRFENNINALPPHGKVKLDAITLHYPEFPLRLYALRINNRADLVVLFNGGLKTASSAQNSELSSHFRTAQRYGKLIEQALADEMILIDEANRKLTDFNGSNDIYL